MGLSIGAGTIDALYVGDALAARAYLGASLVWSGLTAPSVTAFTPPGTVEAGDTPMITVTLDAGDYTLQSVQILTDADPPEALTPVDSAAPYELTFDEAVQEGTVYCLVRITTAEGPVFDVRGFSFEVEPAPAPAATTFDADTATFDSASLTFDTA